jgi:predicted nucleotidyltransferase
MNLIAGNINEINAICEAHHVSRLFVFGSVTTDHFNETSDVDLAVQFTKDIDPFLYFSNYMHLKTKMGKVFERNIDLVEYDSIKNPVFRRIVDRDKLLVYDRTRREIPV